MRYLSLLALLSGCGGVQSPVIPITGMPSCETLPDAPVDAEVEPFGEVGDVLLAVTRTHAWLEHGATVEVRGLEHGLPVERAIPLACPCSGKAAEDGSVILATQGELLRMDASGAVLWRHATASEAHVFDVVDGIALVNTGTYEAPHLRTFRISDGAALWEGAYHYGGNVGEGHILLILRDDNNGSESGLVEVQTGAVLERWRGIATTTGQGWWFVTVRPTPAEPLDSYFVRASDRTRLTWSFLWLPIAITDSNMWLTYAHGVASVHVATGRGDRNVCADAEAATAFAVELDGAPAVLGSDLRMLDGSVWRLVQLGLPMPDEGQRFYGWEPYPMEGGYIVAHRRNAPTASDLRPRAIWMPRETP
jgi:hypothetical protein